MIKLKIFMKKIIIINDHYLTNHRLPHHNQTTHLENLQDWHRLTIITSNFIYFTVAN